MKSKKHSAFVLQGILTEASSEWRPQAPYQRTTPASQHQVARALKGVWEQLCFISIYFVSINKMCPKISEKPKRLFWESESVQNFFHINYSNLICLTSFCLTKCFIGMLYVQIGETSQSFILWIYIFFVYNHIKHVHWPSVCQALF